MHSIDFLKTTIEAWQSNYSFPLTETHACELANRWQALINVIGSSPQLFTSPAQDEEGMDT